MEYVAAGSIPVVAIALPVSVRPGVVSVEVATNVAPGDPGTDRVSVKVELPATSIVPELGATWGMTSVTVSV
jgi:hypothetical protein